ncbi:MAG: glycosyltransferase family 1 protein [Armatimonadetes bacterium CG_4_10_14_3_um_filter_66_18]|nr:glycosyltransferase family 4 protein [Armatimonadota bacterium]OIP11876.1 MAG: hypothetical protein AUJ96_01405 [Armatimonadetes bacterium CG2_30_66_41]PIU89420.1 MAG: glycosyltransferase family 1 protein [Armatimonadetes bacterium CG06_land_8_20_14_3_00_66_21]PIX47683.1 MAG: glycosyltransferase family 1 protein [Armatimonadetes bacterium CG_4_8_14_3_um_filter_66_20]PIY54285.1 MAG: glycosyltransferase family 1 protein [Armatimonadetes bacterium CG_4_10_14_3_um_filter_66_18]PJB64186.1 MAG: g
MHLVKALAALTADLELRQWFAALRTGQCARVMAPGLRDARALAPLAPARFPNAVFCTTPAARFWSRWPREWPVPELLPASYDVFHAPFLPLPFSRRVPLVLTVHDVIPLLHPEWVTRRQWTQLQAVLAGARRAAHVIADSAATRDDLLNLVPEVADRVTVVPLGVAAAFLAEQTPERVQQARLRYGLKRPYVVSVCTLEPRKNLPRLLDAYQVLCSRPRWEHELVLIGSPGWRLGPLRQKLAEVESDGRVHTLGHVPDDDLPALIAGAEVMAFPSLCEGFGLPVLEAMACGTPVVCANTASLPEIASGAAVLVDPLSTECLAEAIADLVQDESLRRRLAEAGRERARRFTWERTARQTLAVYRAAAGARH